MNCISLPSCKFDQSKENVDSYTDKLRIAPWIDVTKDTSSIKLDCNWMKKVGVKCTYNFKRIWLSGNGSDSSDVFHVW